MRASTTRGRVAMTAFAALNRASLVLIICAAVSIGAGRGPAQADDAASGFYLPGSKTAMASDVPHWGPSCVLMLQDCRWTALA